jgi:hypothetical protein
MRVCAKHGACSTALTIKLHMYANITAVLQHATITESSKRLMLLASVHGKQAAVGKHASGVSAAGECRCLP